MGKQRWLRTSSFAPIIPTFLPGDLRHVTPRFVLQPQDRNGTSWGNLLPGAIQGGGGGSHVGVGLVPPQPS